MTLKESARPDLQFIARLWNGYWQGQERKEFTAKDAGVMLALMSMSCFDPEDRDACRNSTELALQWIRLTAEEE